jgi:hypothetical protein
MIGNFHWFNKNFYEPKWFVKVRLFTLAKARLCAATITMAAGAM